MTCWDCDAANPPDRVFCAECGTFIAVGSKVFSGGSATTEPPDRSEVSPLTPGAMSLGAYSVAMRRQAQRRRVVLGTASIALVAIVGLASLYAATSPRGQGEDPLPAALAAATEPATEAPTDASRAGMAPAAGSVDLSEVELEPQLDPAQAAAGAADAEAPNTSDETTPTEVEPAEEAALSEPAAVPVAEVEGPEPDVPPEAAEPDPQPEPVAEVVPVAEPEFAVEPEPAVAAEPAEPAKPEPEEAIVWRNGWVCDGEFALEDARLRDWTITRTSFLPGPGSERVILHLDRIGSGSGKPASVKAETFPRLELEGEVSGVRRPSLGRTVLALQFADGVKTDVNLRGYQPSGLVAVREFSAYPAGSRGSKVLISTSTEGCFKVRAPAWSDSGGGSGQIVIDIKS